MTTTLIPDAEIDEADEAETESTEPTTTCVICDGNGTVCECCTRPQPRCECDGGCERTVICEDCDGDGTKPAATAPTSDYDAVSARSAESVAGEADLRDDEPAQAEDRQAKPATLSDRELFLRDLDRAELMVADAEAGLRVAKSAHKEARELFDSRVAELRKLIRVHRVPLPLFDQPADTTTKPSESNSEETNGTPKESPANPEGSSNDDWRSTCIDALQAHGVSESIVAKLRDKSLETLGDLADFQARHGEFWPKEIKGLGPQKAAKVTDAQAAFWVAHPEFCGNNGAA